MSDKVPSVTPPWSQTNDTIQLESGLPKLTGWNLLAQVRSYGIITWSRTQTYFKIRGKTNITVQLESGLPKLTGWNLLAQVRYYGIITQEEPRRTLKSVLLESGLPPSKFTAGWNISVITLTSGQTYFKIRWKTNNTVRITQLSWPAVTSSPR
jgi:hypothetical protein